MRILIADDEYYARKAMTKKVLQASPDAEIMGDFENGIQVLEYLEEHPDEIDVVLTDVKMPEMDGLETARQILAEAPGFPIVMMSERSTAGMIVEAVKLGARGFVTKPFTPPVLLQEIRQALGHQPEQ